MTAKNRKIDIMGIVNITGDSYFAQSRCLSPEGDPDLEKILGRVRNLTDEGATIIDIGACSTRPGAKPEGDHEEWRRLSPALTEIRREFPHIRLSIDTYWSSVVQRAYDLIGNFIINDISAGEDDPGMLRTAGRLGLTYIAMHKRGTPETMQTLCDYTDVTAEVLDYFREFGRRAEEAGIKNWVLDPGFGFAKNIDQNYQLLRDLDKFNSLGHKILVGVSRKSMIYRLFNITPEESLPQTQVLHLAALERGADILRVHDAAEAVRTVEIWRRLA